MLDKYPDLKVSFSFGQSRSFANFFIRCLYKNAFKVPYQVFMSSASSGSYSDPDTARLKLVRILRNNCVNKMESGVSLRGLSEEMIILSRMFRFADDYDLRLNVTSVTKVFAAWTDYMYEEVRKGEVGGGRAYHMIMTVMKTFLRDIADPFQLKKLAGLARFDRRQKQQRDLSVSEGVVLDYCADLLAIIEELTIERMLQALPVRVYFGSYGFWAELPCSLKHPYRMIRPQEIRNRAPISAEVLLKKRSPLVNLRIQAELSYFIAQTAMNLGQAIELTLGDYRFQSWKGGYEVRKYKGRRKGDVLFFLYPEYLSHFKQYLEFREHLKLYVDRDELFPLNINRSSSTVNDKGLRTLQNALIRARRVYVSPMKLRKSKSNWLLKRGGSPRVVADMMQHTVETLYRNYSKPDPSLAKIEWKNFFTLLDKSSPTVALGLCSKIPGRVDGYEGSLLLPDCKNVAACLFCTSYSGVASYDYVWSLISYRYLKLIESVNLKNISSLPPVLEQYEILLTRIDEILTAFSGQNSKCQGFIETANENVLQENYHPRWRLYIALVNGGVK